MRDFRRQHRFDLTPLMWVFIGFAAAVAMEKAFFSWLSLEIDNVGKHLSVQSPAVSADGDGLTR